MTNWWEYKPKDLIQTEEAQDFTREAQSKTFMDYANGFLQNLSDTADQFKTQAEETLKNTYNTLNEQSKVNKKAITNITLLPTTEQAQLKGQAPKLPEPLTPLQPVTNLNAEIGKGAWNMLGAPIVGSLREMQQGIHGLATEQGGNIGEQLQTMGARAAGTLSDLGQLTSRIPLRGELPLDVQARAEQPAPPIEQVGTSALTLGTLFPAGVESRLASNVARQNWSNAAKSGVEAAQAFEQQARATMAKAQPVVQGLMKDEAAFARMPKPEAPTVEIPIANKLPANLANLPDSYVIARKQAGGKYKLLYTGTRNEVFQNELFNSASEASNYFKAMKIKAQEAPTAIPSGIEQGKSTQLPAKSIYDFEHQTFVPSKGTEVIIPGFENYKFFIDRPLLIDGTFAKKSWEVYESTTGVKLGINANTKEAAIKAAQDRLKLAGEDKLKQAIEYAGQQHAKLTPVPITEPVSPIAGKPQPTQAGQGVMPEVTPPIEPPKPPIESTGGTVPPSPQGQPPPSSGVPPAGAVPPPTGGGVPPGGSQQPPTPPVPPPVQPTGGVPPTPVIPNAMNQVIKQATEQVRQDRPGTITQFMQRIPGVKQVMQFERPGLKMGGKNEKVLVASVAQNQARAEVGTRLKAQSMPVIDEMKQAFGDDVLHGKAQTPYVLTNEQRIALEHMQTHNDTGLQYVVDGYNADIGRFTIQPQPARQGTGTLLDVAQSNGYFLPNVDIAEDIVQFMGGETRAVAIGRGKTRIWPTAADRLSYDPKFKPETDVQKLIEGMDNFKANTAGGNTYREAISGKNRLEVLQETHPSLANRMIGLRKRVANLRGLVRDLNEQSASAIDDFLNSPMEDADLANLGDAIDITVKPGRYVAKASPNVGKSARDLQKEINATRNDIKALRPYWDAANIKPYVFVQEGIYRYFPNEQANLIKENLQTSNNPLFHFMDSWRGQAFNGDFSAITIQGSLGLFADPINSMRSLVTDISKGGIKKAFSIDALTEKINQNPDDYAQFASLTGRNLIGTPSEFAAGFMGKIPLFSKFNEATFVTVTNASKGMYDRIWQGLVKSGMDETIAKVTAGDAVTKIFPMVSPSRLGQSQARNSLLKALPTSYSFIRQPATMMSEAAIGLAKLGVRRQLTPKEQLAVKYMTEMAGTILAVSATSAAISASNKKEDIPTAIWDVVNPNSSKFASLIIGDTRIPLGGPYRAIFKAVFPAKVAGVPIPLPFAGIPQFLKNRKNPALGAVYDIITNKDYYGNPITKGAFPEQVLRGLEYLAESSLPLSLGAAIEGQRLNRPASETVQQAIGQFAGVNLMSETASQTFRKQREQLSVKEYGKPYADLSIVQQNSLKAKYPDVSIAAQKEAQGSSQYPIDLNAMAQNQEEISNRIKAQLPQKAQAELKKYDMSLGISRTIMNDYSLKDVDYLKYQDYTVLEAKKLFKVVDDNYYQRSTKDVQYKILQNAATLARGSAKQLLIVDMMKQSGDYNKVKSYLDIEAQVVKNFGQTGTDWYNYMYNDPFRNVRKLKQEYLDRYSDVQSEITSRKQDWRERNPQQVGTLRQWGLYSGQSTPQNAFAGVR